MDEEEMDIELIEKYLANTLTSDEVAQVDARLKMDVAFAKKVNEYSDIIEGIRNVTQHDFIKEVAAWEDEIKADTKLVKPLWSRSYLSMAAGLVLLILVGMYLFYPRTENPQQLFVDYFTPYQNLISVRGGDEQEILNRAMEFYSANQYDKALPLLTDYLVDSPNDITALFYKGICELIIGNSDSAIKSFDQLLLGKNVFNEQAEWYRLLSYLKKNDKETALQLAKLIAEHPGHYYQSKAKEILKKI
jgi:tetratricopeptide (TPR) repeat protein